MTGPEKPSVLGTHAPDAPQAAVRRRVALLLMVLMVIGALLAAPSPTRADAVDYIVRVTYDGAHMLNQVRVLLYETDRACDTLIADPQNPPSADVAWSQLVIVPDADGTIPDRSITVPIDTELKYAVARATASDGFGGSTTYYVTFGCTDSIPPTSPSGPVVVTIGMDDLTWTAGDDHIAGLPGLVEDVIDWGPVSIGENDSPFEVTPYLTAVVDPPLSHGTAVVEDLGNHDLSISSYTPDPDFCGIDSFGYVGYDGVIPSNKATVTIEVQCVNDPPVANDDSASTPSDSAITVDVAANDIDVDENLDPSTVEAVSSPIDGDVVNGHDGTVTYIPGSGATGTDAFTYRICDTDGLCDTADVSVEVTDPPGPIEIEADIDVRPSRIRWWIWEGRAEWVWPVFLRVHVFGSDTVDVSDIDQPSISLGDPTLEATVGPVRAWPFDSNRDGYPDLVIFFRTTDLTEQGAVKATTERLRLTATTETDTQVVGEDAVTVVVHRFG